MNEVNVEGNSMPTLIMTIGVQCSGKSTWAKEYVKEHTDTVYLSSDELRKELGKGVEDQSVNGHVFLVMQSRTTVALAQGKTVLLDGTFVKKAWRKDFVKIGRAFNAWVVAHTFSAPREVLIQRLNKRVKEGGLNVPVEAIDKYISMFQKPDEEEFDDVIIHNN